jgi:HPt (histidine-containing phosphotransfer) domain-containing protein
LNLEKSRQLQPVEIGAPEEEFEKLRQRFQERLRKEKRHLAALTKALGSNTFAPTSILFDLREFAHRLRGAALVFGFQDVGDAAKAVELAATAATLGANSHRPDPSVVSTTQALARLLADEIGTDAACAPVQSTGSLAKPSLW